jgi:hypothetical protein
MPNAIELRFAASFCSAFITPHFYGSFIPQEMDTTTMLVKTLLITTLLITFIKAIIHI